MRERGNLASESPKEQVHNWNSCYFSFVVAVSGWLSMCQASLQLWLWLGSGQTHSLLGYLHISSYRWSWSWSWSWNWSWSWCATVAVCLQSPSAIELMPMGHLKIPRAFARRRVTHFYEVICVWSALNAAHRALRTPCSPALVFFFTALRKNRNQFLENVRLEKPKRNITHCNGKSIKIITRPVDLSEQANIFQVPFQILLSVLYVSVQK